MNFAAPALLLLGFVQGGAAAPRIEIPDALRGSGEAAAFDGDWLVKSCNIQSRVYINSASNEVTISNGLVRRVFRTSPNAATIDFRNLNTNETLVRAVEPEAVLGIDGVEYEIGGLAGQIEHGYLLHSWLDAMTARPAAFRCVAVRAVETRERFAWKRARYSENRAWPPRGAGLEFVYNPPAASGLEVEAVVHYEIYDGIPAISKWITVKNLSKREIHIDSTICEKLAAVEAESSVERTLPWENPNIYVETDEMFGASSPRSNNVGVEWVPDPQYKSQVHYERKTPNLLIVRPPTGPAAAVAPGGEFTSIRAFELLYDSTDRERRSLSIRKLYRTVAPWITENPILMHVRSAEPVAVRLAIDQCSETGFEMVIMTFGSGFDIENEDPKYLQQIRELADYARSKNIDIGGYSLLASRSVSEKEDIIDPKTGKPGGGMFGSSPCLGSRWSAEYFRKLYQFVEITGIGVIEHDGSYPGDVCASTTHPGHRGLDDSQWTQWRTITDYYKWCRGKGVYLNVPDWYMLNGSNKTGMGYREDNWSLPRDRQVVLGRQNLYDGTWWKTPSMGWMFVPLVEYHGGGAEATLEPLAEHVIDYERHLANNFGFGAQACYRGPRLYDNDEVKGVVKTWVAFYKKHRAILDSDIIHLRRADGQDLDYVLHANPAIAERGMLMIYNPTSKEISRELDIPIYYTGLAETAAVEDSAGRASKVPVSRDYKIKINVQISAGSAAWYILK
ncbi:MAG: alpha-galactosidase [Planctomycetes bacterium]|nr:alpha-galactosidase [Planctomycetota bacterium]